MPYVVREASLPDDFELLLAVYLRNRPHRSEAEARARFEWSYRSNPGGRPRAWLIFNGASGEAVGATAAFPRRFLIDGQPVVGWNGGDTSVDPRFRTLGVAVILRRAVRACVDRGEIAFLYSQPQARMRVVLERIGHVPIGTLTPHVAVLGVGALVETRFGAIAGTPIVAGLVNPVLHLGYRAVLGRARLGVHRQPVEAFGDEYDDLFRRVARHHRVIAVRDAAFLTWRVLGSPLHGPLEIFRLEEAGRLAGYAIVDRAESGARILDWMVEPGGGREACLLRGVFAALREGGASKLAIWGAEHSAILRPLRGFVLKRGNEHHSIMVCAPEGCAALDMSNWFMTHADRDL